MEVWTIRRAPHLRMHLQALRCPPPLEPVYVPFELCLRFGRAQLISAGYGSGPFLGRPSGRSRTLMEAPLRV